MKTKTLFKQISFLPHPLNPSGRSGLIFFDNGYGASVIRCKSPYLFGSLYLTYTRDEYEWELAVIKGNKSTWEITYETPITNDVIGYLSERQVNNILKKIKAL